MNAIEERLKELKVIPVIAIDSTDDGVQLAKVLIDNGLPAAEITFRTPVAAQVIACIAEAYPEMLLGAGTVLTSEQVDLAIDAGVDFIVSPGFNPTTVKYCQQRGVPIIPGVNNPSLVEQAMEMGLKTLKFFPAEASGGTAMLKALSAVYPVSFMPTGGVSAKNIGEYLRINNVLACGGTWMVPADLIKARDWGAIASLVKAIDLG
jgi:2-dehydro-3-deoxyphosphogluconate aldolase/(4S)-4-hydroxy-2-oxoglutarate aldolase